MKLYQIDAEKLMELLEKAKGNIYLITEDGNKLNLKSKLCQLYGVQKLLESAKDSVLPAELGAENPEDELMLVNYMMRK
jgi:hypothetical protein